MKPDIGTKIREARRRKGISQADLAERVGIKQPSLSEIESGITTPRESTLRSIAYELGESLGEAKLQKYLKERKRNPAKRLVEQVIELVRDNDAVLGIFVVRLARANETFRSLLEPSKLKKIRVDAGKDLRLIEGIMAREEDPEIYEWFFEGLDDDEPLDLGTVDEFDIEAAIERLDDPHGVMEEWLRSEGLEYPRDYGVMFFDGWEGFTTPQKVDAIKDARKLLERTLNKKK